MADPAPVLTFRERRAHDICSCSHHMDHHIDGWAACQHGDEVSSCLCGEYDGPITRWDTAADGPHPLLALIKKDTTFAA